MTDIETRIIDLMTDGRERTRDDIATRLKVKPEAVAEHIRSLSARNLLTVCHASGMTAIYRASRDIYPAAKGPAYSREYPNEDWWLAEMPGAGKSGRGFLPCMGSFNGAAQKKNADARRAVIFGVIRDKAPMTSRQISEATGIPLSGVSNYISDLRQAGQVTSRKDRGIFIHEAVR